MKTFIAILCLVLCFAVCAPTYAICGGGLLSKLGNARFAKARQSRATGVAPRLGGRVRAILPRNR